MELTENTDRIAALSESNLTQHTINLTQQHFVDPPKFTKAEFGYHHHQHHQSAAAAAAAAAADGSSEGLHMAEQLVECAALQKKSAFQFDTITPKKTALTKPPPPPPPPLAAASGAVTVANGPKKILTNSKFIFIFICIFICIFSTRFFETHEDEIVRIKFGR